MIEIRDPASNGGRAEFHYIRGLECMPRRMLDGCGKSVAVKSATRVQLREQWPAVVAEIYASLSFLHGCLRNFGI